MRTRVVSFYVECVLFQTFSHLNSLWIGTELFVENELISESTPHARRKSETNCTLLYTVATTIYRVTKRNVLQTHQLINSRFLSLLHGDSAWLLSFTIC